MTTPTDMRERMRRTALGTPREVAPRQPLAVEGNLLRPRKGNDRKRFIRYSLDLSREQHRYVRQYALDHDADMSLVLRVLIDEMQKDTAWQQRVADTLSEVQQREEMERDI